MAKNVVIIGGGASGLMAAIWASRLGAAVTVLEKNDKPGRKLLATGNGRCNFTNRYQDASCYRTGNQERASRVLEQFTEQDTEQFFEQLGIRIRSREGWLYPASEQAQSVLELLILEARFRKVKIKTRETAVAVEKAENGYLVRTEGWQYPAAKQGIVKKQDRAHGQKEGKSPPHRAVFFLHPTASCRQGPPACGRLLPKPLYKLYSTRRPGELQSSIPHAILL